MGRERVDFVVVGGGSPSPGQGARRQQQHQRDELPAGQPGRLRPLGAEGGVADWDYGHCLPYFTRIESSDGALRQTWRGYAGPQPVLRGSARGPLLDAFFDAAVQAGHRTSGRSTAAA